MYTYEGDVFMLSEVRGILVDGDNAVKVDMIPPIDRLPEPYKSLDIKKDDVILYINKKRVRNVNAFKEKYEALAIGDTVMLGVKRGEGDMFILRFPKADPEKSGGGVMRVVQAGDGAAPTVLGNLGLILTEKDQQVKVMGVLPTAEKLMGVKLEQGDFLASINDEEVANIKMLMAKLDEIKIGDPVTLVFERGDEILTAKFDKPEESQQSSQFFTR
jgi:S1-C subfamily serine protease